MEYTLENLEEDLSGIWDSDKYELHLGLNKVFVFEIKDSENPEDIIDGFYSVFKNPKNKYPTLRLTEHDGTIHDYLINDLLVFEFLIISNEKETIHFKNIPPDEYEGEIINPANN